MERSSNKIIDKAPLSSFEIELAFFRLMSEISLTTFIKYSNRLIVLINRAQGFEDLSLKESKQLLATLCNEGLLNGMEVSETDDFDIREMNFVDEGGFGNTDEGGFGNTWKMSPEDFQFFHEVALAKVRAALFMTVKTDN